MAWVADAQAVVTVALHPFKENRLPMSAAAL